MMYEIRNYHFDPALFEDYKAWAKSKALPYLSNALDLVGFWTNLPEESDIIGEPMDGLGSANITWIIRWEDKATRDSAFEAAFSTPEWQAIFAEVPGGFDSYKRMEAKFTEALI